MNRSLVLASLLLLGANTFGQTVPSPAKAPSNNAQELAALKLEEIDIVGSHSFSKEQILSAFHVGVGNKFDREAIGQGLERLRRFFGEHGYINFTAVPTVQTFQNRGTIVLTLDINDGAQFTFGHLVLSGREAWAGEADALHKAWTALSGETYASSALCKWLSDNAPYLPNKGQPPCGQFKLHQSSETHQADVEISLADRKS